MGHIKGTALKTSRGLTLVELMIATTVLTVLILAFSSMLYKVFQYQSIADQVTDNSADVATLTNFTKILENTTGFICNCRGTKTTPRTDSSVPQDARDCTFNDSDPETDDVCKQGTWFDVYGGTCPTDPFAPSVPKPIVVAGFVAEVSPQPLELTDNYMKNTSIIPFFTDYGNPCFHDSISGVFNNIYAGYIVGTKLKTHGCQKVLQLLYTPPSRKSQTAGGPASLPGKLQLRDVTYSINSRGVIANPSPSERRNAIMERDLQAQATSYKYLMSLDNISAFRCGLVREDKPTPHSSQLGFRFFIMQKLLNKPSTANTLNNESMVSSYHPDDDDFRSAPATWKRFTETTTFKNLNQRGRHYGAASSRPCTADSSISVTDYKDCCSQYIDKKNHCTYSCKGPGQGASLPGECCSYDLDRNGLCL